MSKTRMLPSLHPKAILASALVFTLPANVCQAQAPEPPTAPAEDKMEIRKDLPYASPENPRQKLDLYLPTPRTTAKLPIVVFIHGGGWKAGNKASGAANLSRLVLSRQYIGVSIAYRLTDEVRWPAQLHDCKAAIRWIKEHAAEFGGDPQRIGVWGISAGAHLASLLGTTGDAPEWEGEIGSARQQNSKIQCVINFYGPQNFITMVQQESAVDRTTKNYPEALLLGGRVQDLPEVAKAASPITYASKGDAPFLSAHGTKDPLVPLSQARELDAALRRAGVESVLIEMQEAGHGFRSAELDSRIDLFLSKHLHQKTAEIPTTPIAKGQ